MMIEFIGVSFFTLLCFWGGRRLHDSGRAIAQEIEFLKQHNGNGAPSLPLELREEWKENLQHLEIFLHDTQMIRAVLLVVGWVGVALTLGILCYSVVEPLQ